MIDIDNEAGEVEAAASAPPHPAAQPQAPWEMIEPGRYQPKRIRGSCVGRELG